MNITKPKFAKWEIEINSVPKNTKDLCKNTKTNIPLRLGDYEYLSFIDPERRGFGVIFPEVMIFSKISSLREISGRCVSTQFLERSPERRVYK